MRSEKPNSDNLDLENEITVKFNKMVRMGVVRHFKTFAFYANEYSRHRQLEVE